MTEMDPRLTILPRHTDWTELPPRSFCYKTEMYLSKADDRLSRWYLGRPSNLTRNHHWVYVSQLEAMLLLQGTALEALTFFEKVQYDVERTNL